MYAATLFLVSCSLNEDLHLTASSVESRISLGEASAVSDMSIPFSSKSIAKSILDALPPEGLLNWKTARALAMMRLANVRDEQGWRD